MVSNLTFQRLSRYVYHCPPVTVTKRPSAATSAGCDPVLLCVVGAAAIFAGVRPSGCATSPPVITWLWARTVDWSCRTGRSPTQLPLPSASGPQRSVFLPEMEKRYPNKRWTWQWWQKMSCGLATEKQTGSRAGGHRETKVEVLFRGDWGGIVSLSVKGCWR